MIQKLITAVKERLQGKVPLLSKRSSKWETVRKNWLCLNNECAACGSKESLQTHHKIPFHLHPELELDYNNFITLCEKKGGLECHLHIGHRGLWKNEVPTVEEDAKVARKARGLKDLITRIPANK